LVIDDALHARLLPNGLSKNILEVFIGELKIIGPMMNRQVATYLQIIGPIGTHSVCNWIV